MTGKSYIGLVCAVFCISAPAFAFQEQKVGGEPAPAAAVPVIPDVPAAVAQQPSGLTLSPAESPKPAAGTEVRIPGLGKLGVLPKMDFGLELLYGANEPKSNVEEQEAVPDEDLTIRGTVKHKF